MPEITLTIRHKVGLHARKVLTLGANQGAVITIRAEGVDADQALAALAALVEDNFGEAG